MRQSRLRAESADTGGSHSQEQAVPVSVNGSVTSVSGDGAAQPASRLDGANGGASEQSPLALTSVDSLNSGLTRTTPTLTPTTLRNIEETFMAFDRDLVAPPVSHQHQAGFVTPQVSAGGGGGLHPTVPEPQQPPWQPTPQRRPAPPAGAAPPEQPPHTVPQQQGHTRGGRRPKDDEEISPEEEQRRRVRRERNKQAAARCRRRRLDLTNTLQVETEELEDRRSSLEREIQQLQAQKEELRFLLDAHQPCCKLSRNKENALQPRRVIVKQEAAVTAAAAGLLQPTAEALQPRPGQPAQLSRRSPAAEQLAQLSRRDEQQAPPPPAKQPRPTSLSVAPFANLTGMHKDVPISTPSQGIGLNFDSMMQGGTGLTPIGGGPALPPMAPPVAATPALVTPVVTQPDGSKRSDLLSPGVKELVSL